MGGDLEYRITNSHVSGMGEVDPVPVDTKEAKTKLNLEDLVDKLAGIVVSFISFFVTLFPLETALINHIWLW